MHGLQLRHFIEAGLRPTLDELLVTARTTGHAAEVRLRVAGDGTPIDLSATPFRAEAQHCLLLRARRAGASVGEPQAVMDFIGQTPDTRRRGGGRFRRPRVVGQPGFCGPV